MAKKATLGVKPRGKRWQARPYIPGVGHKWAGTHDTEAEAVEAAEAKHEEWTTRPPKEETISSFTKRHARDHPREKGSTNDDYKGAARRFRERVDPNDKIKMHEYGVPAAMAYWRDHPGDAKIMRSIWEDARREGLVTEKVWERPGLKKSKGRKYIVAITAEELQLLVAIAEDVHGPYGPIFGAIIEWSAATTMRPSETFGLDVTDLWLPQGKVNIERQFHKGRIQPPKNGLTRVLPYIPPRAVEAIRRMPRRVPPSICPLTGGEILFVGKEGQRIRQQALNRYWGPVRAAFEIALPAPRRVELRSARNPEHPEMDFYELRHYGATDMAERNVEDWVGAEMMGHTDGGKLFREHYSHPSNKVAGERLRRAFGQNVAPLRSIDGAKEAVGG